MKTGTKVVLMFALIEEEKYDELKVPHGSMAKAFKVGNLEDLLDQNECKSWGGLIAIAICRAANKLCPEAALILKPVQNAEQPI